MTIAADFNIMFETTAVNTNRVIVYKKWEVDDPWEIRDIIEYAPYGIDGAANLIIEMIDEECWSTSNVYMGSACVGADVLETEDGRKKFLAKFTKDTPVK